MINRREALASLAALAVAGSITPTWAQGPRKIKVGEVIRSQFFIPMYVALGKGYVAEQGLDVELVSAGGSDKVGALVLTDSVDFGLAGPEVTIYIHNGESTDKPLLFSALTGTDGYFLVSKEKIENFEWSMLNGKSILAQRPGSTPQLCFDHLLKKNNVDAQTIANQVTNIGLAARDGAWLSGAYDFGLFIEPSLSRLENAGQMHVIGSIGKELGRVEYTSFFAKRSWLDANPEVAQQWTNAIAQAQHWMKTASTAEIAEVVAPFFIDTKPEDHVPVIDRFLRSGAPIWADNPEVDAGGIERLQEIMIEGGVMEAGKKVDYDAIVTKVYSDKAIALVTGG